MYRFPMAGALLLAVVASGCGRKVNPQEAKAVAAIEKLGGTVTVDEKSAEIPVISVSLVGTVVDDAALEQLKELTQLQRLDLSDTHVTDAGLEHLKGFTQLQSLNLNETAVSKEGVKKLQQALPKCKISPHSR